MNSLLVDGGDNAFSAGSFMRLDVSAYYQSEELKRSISLPSLLDEQNSSIPMLVDHLSCQSFGNNDLTSRHKSMNHIKQLSRNSSFFSVQSSSSTDMSSCMTASVAAYCDVVQPYKSVISATIIKPRLYVAPTKILFCDLPSRIWRINNEMFEINNANPFFPLDKFDRTSQVFSSIEFFKSSAWYDLALFIHFHDIQISMKSDMEPLRLRGGGETALSNGTSSWGPPPSSGASMSWGQTLPTSPPSNSAWTPVPNHNTGISHPPISDENLNASSIVPRSISPPDSQLTTSAASAIVGGPVAAQQLISTSWAAAAGKGLPISQPTSSASTVASGQSVSDSTHSLSASKQLEQLQNVREALFSLDGWGGCNVKQDTVWDTGIASPSDTQPNSAMGGKEQHISSVTAWGVLVAGNGSRNDGTDLWKTTLSGLPPPVKPQPTNPWGAHTPTNPTDYKNWGEEDDLAGNNSQCQSDRMNDQHYWRQDHVSNTPSASYGTVKKDDWINNTNVGWNMEQRSDSMHNNPMGRMGSDNMLITPRTDMMPPIPRGDPSSVGWNPRPPIAQWSSGAAGRGGWPDEIQQRNHHSGQPPPMGRLPIDDGTSLWGAPKIQSVPPHIPGPGGNNLSHWKDMPIPNSAMIRGQPPARIGPPGALKENCLWSSQQSLSRGWAGDEPWTEHGSMDPAIKRDWNDVAWGGGRPRIRGSPNWDEPAIDPGLTGGWGNSVISTTVASSGIGVKPPIPKPIPKEMIWNSKQFRVLVDMGYNKVVSEDALRSSGLNLEDAIEMLNMTHGRMRGVDSVGGGSLFGNAGDHYDSVRGGSNRFPPINHGGLPQNMSYPPQDGNLNGGPIPTSLHQSNPSLGPAMAHKLMANGGLNAAAAVNSSQSVSRSSQTQNQLRTLVYQIQMAVQAGHLNAQILNQPLAPQTLVLLNQLLQQIKTMQHLQHQHNYAQQKGIGLNNGALVQITLNLSKTRQQIQSLQNQISALQANYLSKSQQQQPSILSSSNDQQQPSMADIFQNLSVVDNASSAGGQGCSAGSRLSQWKLGGTVATDDSLQKNSSAQKTSSCDSPNLILEDGPWSASSSGVFSGWPDSKSGGLSSPPAVSGSVNGLDNFAIPEFEPGKPWKGPGLKNPDEDPNVTPGSVAIIDQKPYQIGLDSKVPSSSSSDSDVNVSSSQNNWAYGGICGTPKDKTCSGDTWTNSNNGGSISVGSNLTPMGQDLWGKSATARSVAISSMMPSTSGWSLTNGLDKLNMGGRDTVSMQQPPGGQVWSSGISQPMTAVPENSWLILKNLTTQIDGATLKTLCLQHGPLKEFHLFLNNAIALLQYNTVREANKAQKALNNCLLNNTTIHAQCLTEIEALAIGNQLRGLGQSSAQYCGFPSSSTVKVQSSTLDPVSTWACTSNSLYGTGVWAAPGVTDMAETQRGTQLNSFLPGNLLGDGNL